VVDLTERLTKLQLKSLFRLENIRYDDVSVHFHTGFPNYETLVAFCKDVLEEDAKVMRQWRNGESYTEMKSGRNCKLSILEKFFLT